jgi:hypothetical protein
LLDRGSQPSDDSAGLFGLPEKLVEQLRRDVTNIHSHIQMRPNFGAGRLGDGQELVEFARAFALEALSDVRHD